MYSSVDEYIGGLETREEIVGFLAEIEKLREAAYKTGEEGLERVLQTAVGDKSARVVREELERSGKMADPHFQEEYFAEIAKKLKGIPVVSLELAQQPSKELISRIRERLSEYTNSLVVIDYQVNKNLLAGVRVACGGKYFDYSLDSMWPDIWKAVMKYLEPKA
jgi:hypothetical protein